MSESKENIKNLAKEMIESEKEWDARIRLLTTKLNGDIRGTVELQSEVISYRQMITDEVKLYAVRIWKLVQKMKVLHKARYEFYATAYQVKTSGTEKVKLIDADLSEHQLFISELDEHVNFLRDTGKNLDNMHYSIKNKIELENILGGYK
jgi:hypothetical protein